VTPSRSNPIDAPLNVIPVREVNDPRLRPYTALKDRRLAAELGLFICEGLHNVQRLLDSAIAVHSVLIAERRLAEVAGQVSSDIPIYTATNEMLSCVVGFDFHMGVLACGVRPAGVTVDSLLPARTLVVLPEVRHAENLGLIIRAAHALGVDGMLLSDIGCDPFARRVIRVSMGSVFALPVVRSASLKADLVRLKAEHGLALIAAVADRDAVPIDTYARPAERGVAVLFGNEPEGLSDAWAGVCDTRVTVPITPGVDSLNLAVAAGIVLHRLASPNAR
jgi:tRNA G18 (ribose-2'-O)-methylase SpoU